MHSFKNMIVERVADEMTRASFRQFVDGTLLTFLIRTCETRTFSINRTACFCHAKHCTLIFCPKGLEGSLHMRTLQPAA